MRLEDIDTAKTIMDEIRSLEKDIRTIHEPNGLGITINGRYQKEDMVSLARPIVESALRKEIDNRLNKLNSMGIM